jgi:hypothetical protein
MEKVKMKITGYDDASNSLLVSFASDTTKSANPEDYPSYAFQPLTMWPDISDLNEIKKRIATAGIYHVTLQEAEEKFIADPDKVTALKNMVGQTYDFSATELAIVAHETPYQVV